MIPAQNFDAELLNNKSVVFDDNGCTVFDDSVFWKGDTINFIDQIEEILPRKKSWSKNLFLFGDEESNEFSIFYENNKVVSVSFRLDFRTNYEIVLRMIIELCIINQYIIIDEKIKLVELNFNSIKQQIEDSPQYLKYNDLLIKSIGLKN